MNFKRKVVEAAGFGAFSVSTQRFAASRNGLNYSYVRLTETSAAYGTPASAPGVIAQAADFVEPGSGGARGEPDEQPILERAGMNMKRPRMAQDDLGGIWIAGRDQDAYSERST